jgi:hypothetical protein
LYWFQKKGEIRVNSLYRLRGGIWWDEWIPKEYCLNLYKNGKI